MAWKRGDRLSHRYNPDLGPGVVQAVDGRTLVVLFPEAGTTLRLAAGSDALRPLEWLPRSPAMLLPSGERVTVQDPASRGRVRLVDGREVAEAELWPIRSGHSLVERLAQGDIDPLEDFSLRLDALYLQTVREADGLGSFLGGRIRLFPHQLHVAESATRADPVRWLLADEVGLGKTVESCLILNHLVRTGRADRTVVVAPETLTVQWLGELWRKYHQVFCLLDEKRLIDVEKVYGPRFNPFEAHRRVVIGMTFLQDRPWLTERAVEAGVDLLIVDEAHHLRRPPGHPGNAAYRAIQPITALGRHVLLLSATPLEEDAHGFFRLLQLLRPDEFPEQTSFEDRLERGCPLPPCTSSTRRQDIGGLPPRSPDAVELNDDPGWDAMLELEHALRRQPAPHAVALREKLRRIRRALASGAAVEPLLDDPRLLRLARQAVRSDPRIRWLVRQARQWRQAGDKTLVFVAHRETLEALKAALSREAQLRVGVFHEELSAGQRDIEVAQFRLPQGPSLLISTECGGEGRNFEFCTRVVLFDLPWNPMAVEQRIGRLDRIGRARPVEITYPVPPSGLGASIARLYEQLGLFRRPLGGIERELAAVPAAIEELALSSAETPEVSALHAVVGSAEAAYDRVQRAAHQELHRNPYRPGMAKGILARIPPGVDELTEEVVLSAAERLALHVEEHRGGLRHSIELGSGARVESLPGVPGGASFLGTFRREEAVQDESIDYFASGHPLIEGILAHIADDPAGRVALLHASGQGERGFGLLALYKSGPRFEAVALDENGQERPEWARLLIRRPLKSRRIQTEEWVGKPDWADRIRDLSGRLEGRGQPVALAAFRLD